MTSLYQAGAITAQHIDDAYYVGKSGKEIELFLPDRLKTNHGTDINTSLGDK